LVVVSHSCRVVIPFLPRSNPIILWVVIIIASVGDWIKTINRFQNLGRGILRVPCTNALPLLHQTGTVGDLTECFLTTRTGSTCRGRRCPLSFGG
jgi:hypothetical protein